MKTVLKTMGILTLVVALESCSSVKVTDTWEDTKTPDIRNKSILVVNKTDNKTAQERFEKDLVKGLNNNGFQSVGSFAKYPELEQTNADGDTNVKELKDILKSDGIDVVILTVLREIKEFTVTTTNASDYHLTIYPSHYGRRYHRGFNRFYHAPYHDSSLATSTTTEGKSYILETVLYDLTQAEDKQLIAVLTTEIHNPKTLGTTSVDFAKKIVKELKI